MARFLSPAVLALLVLLGAHGAFAQSVGANVLPGGCGTASYTAGTAALTQDTTGKACVNATVSASTSFTPVTNTPHSGSVTTTNTFQSIVASNASRKGCVVQNTGTHVEYVFFGAIAGATTTNSIALYPASAAGQAGGSVSCAVGGLGVATDQVSITGTAADTFVAYEEN